MGGVDSGRHWDFVQDTTDDYRSLDIRWLKREGVIQDGSVRRVVWNRNGVEISSIGISSEAGHLVFDYRRRQLGGDWKTERYQVHLETSQCHIGGARHWFCCPAKGCGRRVAILYDGSIFVCRHCLKLVYSSQRERIAERAARRADRIRDKLGWEPGLSNGTEPWNRPKGMHRTTFERLCEEHDRHEARCRTDVIERYGIDFIN